MKLKDMMDGRTEQHYFKGSYSLEFHGVAATIRDRDSGKSVWIGAKSLVGNLPAFIVVRKEEV